MVETNLISILVWKKPAGEIFMTNQQYERADCNCDKSIFIISKVLIE